MFIQMWISHHELILANQKRAEFEKGLFDKVERIYKLEMCIEDLKSSHDKRINNIETTYKEELYTRDQVKITLEKNIQRLEKTVENQQKIINSMELKRGQFDTIKDPSCDVRINFKSFLNLTEGLDIAIPNDDAYINAYEANTTTVGRLGNYKNRENICPFEVNGKGRTEGLWYRY
jgi:hypothetical protein